MFGMVGILVSEVLGIPRVWSPKLALAFTTKGCFGLRMCG